MTHTTVLLVVLILSLLWCLCSAHKRHFSLSIGFMHGSPDGFSRKMIVINNQYPGPLLEFDTGDEVTVSVFNNMTDRGTSIHWHGFNQYATPFMDGVPGVTQCEIPPLSHFDYHFTVNDQWGTFWYHSHSGTQYMDGALGPIIVHNPNEEKRKGMEYDEDLIIMLHDWYHTQAPDLLMYYMSPKSGGHEPNPDSALMNGMGKFNCSSIKTLSNSINSCDNNPPMFKAHVKHGKKYRLRILNSAAISHYMFSIDNHNLTLIEADGVDTEPLTVKSIPINVGQRYSAILHANNPTDNYWIRGNVSVADLQPGWTMTPWVQGILHYENAGHHEPTSKYEEQPTLKENDLLPYVSMPAPTPVGKYVDIYAQFFVPNETEGTQYAYMNNISFALPSTPILQLVKHKQKIPDSAYVIDLPTLGEVVQVSLYNYDNGEHPFHLHGHNFSIIGKTSVPPDSKTGECDHASVNGLSIKHPSLKNPLRRDTATVAGCGLLVFRFVTDNPGTWFFHCPLSFPSAH